MSTQARINTTISIGEVPLPMKDLHIDIQWDYTTGADYAVKWNLRRMMRIVDTTAAVLPLEEESGEETTCHGHRSTGALVVRR